jgi:hypothetical protein
MNSKNPSWSQITDRATRRKLWDADEQRERMRADLEMV